MFKLLNQYFFQFISMGLMLKDQKEKNKLKKNLNDNKK